MRIVRSRVLATVVILAGCALAPATSTVPVASTGAPEATPTVRPTTSAATPSATPIEGDLTDQLVAVVTQDLVVRSRPGTGSHSEIYSARLNAPTIVYVIDGPENADGYAWYLVDPLSPPCYLGCEGLPETGWVAAASKDGERWLADEPENPECPPPMLEEVSRAYSELQLFCFGARDLTFSGVVGASVEWARPGWPWEHVIGLYEPGWRGPITGCVDACNIPLLTLAFDGERGVPSPLSATRVSGHFDDAQAPECRSSHVGIEVDQRILTHECRMVFVVTTWD